MTRRQRATVTLLSLLQQSALLRLLQAAALLSLLSLSGGVFAGRRVCFQVSESPS